MRPPCRKSGHSHEKTQYEGVFDSEGHNMMDAGGEDGDGACGRKSLSPQNIKT